MIQEYDFKQGMSLMILDVAKTYVALSNSNLEFGAVVDLMFDEQHGLSVCGIVIACLLRAVLMPYLLMRFSGTIQGSGTHMIAKVAMTVIALASIAPMFFLKTPYNTDILLSGWTGTIMAIFHNLLYAKLLSDTADCVLVMRTDDGRLVVAGDLTKDVAKSLDLQITFHDI